MILYFSPELTRLWSLSPDNLAACQSAAREFLPSLQDYFLECVEQEDPKNAIEAQYKLVLINFVNKLCNSSTVFRFLYLQYNILSFSETSSSAVLFLYQYVLIF